MQRVSRRSRRIGLFLLLFLMGGAIVNVAVAWGCALDVNPYELKPERQAASDRTDGVATLVVIHRVAFGSSVFQVFSSAGTDLPQLYDAPPIRKVVPGWAERIERRIDAINIADGRGWPAISMSSAMRMPNAPSVKPFVVHEGWVLEIVPPIQRGTQTIPRVVPVRPIWPGFAINTLLYAAILWLLFAAPFAVRRRSRRRRGLCVKCGYDLRGGAAGTACPECGATFTR